MPWGSYKGKSVGRIIQFIYRYCGCHIAERIQIGNKEITYFGEPFATFEWDEKEIPHFTFSEKFKHFQKIQDDKKNEAINLEIMRQKGAY